LFAAPRDYSERVTYYLDSEDEKASFHSTVKIR
jgi:hypothetical protein